MRYASVEKTAKPKAKMQEVHNTMLDESYYRKTDEIISRCYTL